MTLVQHAGTTRTVSGPAALSTYRSASESLHPAHAEVHFSTYSSLGISAMVSNSCSDSEGSMNADGRSRICYYLSIRLVKKVSNPARQDNCSAGQDARNTRRPSIWPVRLGWARRYSSRTPVTDVATTFVPPRCVSSSGLRLRFFKQLSAWYPVSPSV